MLSLVKKSSIYNWLFVVSDPGSCQRLEIKKVFLVIDGFSARKFLKRLSIIEIISLNPFSTIYSNSRSIAPLESMGACTGRYMMTDVGTFTI